MAEFDPKNRKLTVKIVYYGPALSGKTTNLMQLHDLVEAPNRGDLMTFETRGDRTLFFDLLPVMVVSETDFRVKIKLYTVPGQVAHDATRKAVLSRADGVVFVADSQRNQAVSNFESFDNLEKNIARVGLDAASLPVVVQFNKRDLKSILPKTVIVERWRPTGLPVVLSAALYGRGVRETFHRVLSRVYRRIDGAYRLNQRWRISEACFCGVSGVRRGETPPARPKEA